MKRRLPTVAALLTALVVGSLPALAMGQSAGDNQYSDPLAQSDSSTTAASTKSTPATAPSATKTPPVALPTTTTTTSPSSTTTSSSSTTTPSTSLPRTGLNEWTLVGLAAVLLLVGFGLRLRTAGVRRR